MMVKKLLGDLVKEERLRRNLSQNALAENVHVSLRTISDIENYNAMVLCQHTHPQILKLSSYTLMVIFAMSSNLALLPMVLASSDIYLFTTKTL